MQNNEIKPIAEFIRRARELRRNQTKIEDLLWRNIRGRKFCNKKFNRQFPIIYQYDKKAHYFIVDFYCHEHKLIIELDGGYHSIPEQKEYDAWRTEILENLGLRVIRFKNEEGIMKILEGIRSALGCEYI
jgi:very-short-patch-repair endonuclease